MRADSELMVITKSKDMIKYLFDISENAPKKFRFSLISKMQDNALDVLESLIKANEFKPGADINENNKRREYQQKAIADLKVLDALIMIAREQQCILPKQYEIMSGLISDCVNLTGAWINSDKKRFQNTGIRL